MKNMTKLLIFLFFLLLSIEILCIDEKKAPIRDRSFKINRKKKKKPSIEFVTVADLERQQKRKELPIEVRKAINIYHTFQVSGKEEFQGAADFFFVPKITKLLQEYYSLRSTEKINIVVIGLNHGDLLRDLVKCLSNISYTGYGFEIEHANFRKASLALANNPNLKLYEIGISNHSGIMNIGGAGQTAGLYSEKTASEKLPHLPKGNENSTVKIMPLVKFVYGNKIHRVHYLTIDVEGHETCVLQGMQLDSPANQKMFSMFQMELGGTWVVEDPRHPVGSWTQYETMVYLEKLGYKLYLIGMRVLLPVTSLFFKFAPLSHQSGVVFGNLLVAHPIYAHPLIIQFLKSFEDFDRLKKTLRTSRYPRVPISAC